MVGPSRGPGNPLVIVDYDPRWAVMFEEERSRLNSAVGDVFLSVEHIGSTSVPGLAAKPIIDIMAGVRRLEDVEERIPALEGAGYRYSPPEEVGFPERRYFDRSARGQMIAHLHVVELGGEFWVRHLLFRDWLRIHPEDAASYGNLKRGLATLFSTNREGYTNAKGPFIRNIEERARAAAGFSPPTSAF